jgi:hypothetical protein
MTLKFINNIKERGRRVVLDPLISPFHKQQHVAAMAVVFGAHVPPLFLHFQKF